MLYRLRWHLRDWLAFGSAGILISIVREAAARLASVVGRSRKAMSLGSAAARFRPNDRLRAPLESWLARLADRQSTVVLTGVVRSTETKSDRIAKAVVLKAPGQDGERGVLYMAAEGQWAKIARAFEAGFPSEYALVLAPAWSLPHAPIHLAFPRLYGRPLAIQLSNPADEAVFRRLAPQYRPVPLFASSWVDHRRFTPTASTVRDIDLLMVANFHHFKRHFALFEVMQSLPKRWRIVLAGQSERGRGPTDILDEAKHFGVAGRFQLLSDVDYSAIPDLFQRAKASIVLSRREGSCVVVAESLFADTPVGVLEDAWMGSRSFINHQTGALLRGGRLGDDIRKLVESTESFSPRKWAFENISYQKSTQVLNDALRRIEEEQGLPWTSDIAELVWTPNPNRAEQNPSLEAATLRIEERYGLKFA